MAKNSEWLAHENRRTDDSQTSPWGISFQSPSFAPKDIVYQNDGGHHIFKNPLSVFRITADDKGSMAFDLTGNGKNMDEHKELILETKSQIFIEQDLKKHQKLIGLDALDIRLDGVIDQCVDRNGGAYDPERHGAGLLWYFFLSDASEDSQSEIGNEEGSFWFCLPVFDCRHDFVKSSTRITSGMFQNTHQLIYSMGSQMYLKKPIEYKRAYSIELDILPYLQDAYVFAINNGFLTDARFENVTIRGMRIGWTVNGVFDVSSSIQKISVKRYLK